MIYLNNQLLTSKGIISFFEKNVLGKEHPSSSKAPSPLRQLKNKLQAIFFGDLVGCDLALMSAPLGEIDITTLSQSTPSLIKQGEDYFIYGNTDGRNWKLTQLDRDVIVQANLNFPLISSSSEALSYNWQYNRVYDNIRMKEGLSNFNKRPSDDNMREILATDTRFNTSYPRLKETLTTIFSLTDADNNVDAVSSLTSSTLIDWNASNASAQFRVLNTVYGYFDEVKPEDFAALLTLFTTLTEACRTIIVLFENNNNVSDTLAYDYAYKLMALFVSQSDLKNTEKLFDVISQGTYKLLNQSDSKPGKPFHDTLLVGLQLPPASYLTDRAGWKKLIKKEGCKAFFFLSMAQKIEQKIAEQDAEAHLRAPNDLLEAQAMAKLCRYSRAYEDSDFADLCYGYKVSEYRFNRCLDYLSSGWPKKLGDSIADVIIKGENEAAGYYWVKLPISDKRALILGDITMCCQSMGGESEACVKDAVSLDDNGLYVLLRQRAGRDPAPIVDGKINDTNFDIVGQAYAWKSNTGNLCLDSIECLNSVGKPIIQRILTDFSTHVLNDDATIKRVTIGRGGKTPPALFSQTRLAEKMRQGVSYGDAKTQYCIGKTPYNCLDEHQAQALNSLWRSYSPFKTYSLEFKECIDYLSYYIADKTQFVDQLKTLLSASSSLSSELTPQTLNILLALNNHPTIDDLKPVNLDELDRLSQAQKDAVLAHISTARLVWRTLINPNDISRVLEYVPKNELTDVVKAMDIYGENWELRRHLTPAQHRAVYGAVKDKLPDLIKSASEFKAVMECLDPGHCRAVCERLKTKLSDIMTAYDFSQAIAGFSVEKRAAIGQALIDKLPNLIHSTDDFHWGVMFLNRPERAAVYMGIKDKFISIIKSGRDFCQIVKSLDLDMRTAFCEESIDKLADEVIKSGAVFETMMKYLSPKQRDEFCQAWLAKVPYLIKSGSEFGDALRHLSTEQRTIVYEALNDKLPTLIISSADFSSVLSPLLPEQRTAIYEAMKDRLPHLIKSIDDFHNVRKHLAPEQSIAVYETMRNELPSLIKPYILQSDRHSEPYDNLSRVLHNLSTNECADIVPELNDVLPAVIKSSDDYLGISWGLDLEKNAIIYEAMQGILPLLIKTAKDYDEARTYLPPEESMALYELLKDNVPHIIKPIIKSARDVNSFHDFYDMMKTCPKVRREALYESLKDKLPSLIKSANELNTAMLYLSSEQRIALYEAIKTKLPSLVKSIPDYTFLCGRCVSPEIRQFVYDALKNKLPSMIKSSEDFEAMVKPSSYEQLTLEQSTILYEAVKDKLPGMLKSAYDVKRIMKLLSPEQRTRLYEAVKHKLPSLVQSIDHFLGIMEHLSAEQRTTLYEAVKHRLPAMMQRVYDLNNALYYLPEDHRPALTAAVTLYHLMTDIRSIASNTVVKTFATALMSDNNETIKAQLDSIIAHANQSKPSLFSCLSFSATTSIDQVINVLSGLESSWLKKINKALELDLTDEQLDVAQDVKTALKQYVSLNPSQRINWTLNK